MTWAALRSFPSLEGMDLQKHRPLIITEMISRNCSFSLRSAFSYTPPGPTFLLTVIGGQLRYPTVALISQEIKGALSVSRPHTSRITKRHRTNGQRPFRIPVILFLVYALALLITDFISPPTWIAMEIEYVHFPGESSSSPDSQNISLICV